MSVAVVVPEGCVLCIEISQDIDWYVAVIEKGVKTCEGEPSVTSTVCRGIKKGSMLGVYLCCQKVS